MIMPLQARFSSRVRLTAPALAAGLAIRPTFAQVGGTPVSEVSDSSPVASPVTGSSDWLEIATSMWDAIQRDFYLPDFGLYLERAPLQNEDRAFSFLWPYSALLSGINALAEVSPMHEEARDNAFRNLEQYWDEHSDPPGYDSYVVEYGGGDKFYDDNEWLGIDFVHAWRRTGNSDFLDKAKIVWNFVISGWTDEFGGGIYWKQGDFNTKNTCSNAPAAVMALMLFEETGDKDYLDWAIRIMEWVIQLKDPASGVYRDNIDARGNIEPTTWTYNTGTPIHANALLYRATNDETWLTEARDLAAASLEHFAPGTETETTIDGDAVRAFPDTPWFNSILFRGYAALFEIDPEQDRTYLDAAFAFAQFGWQHARDGNGFLNKDWSGRTNLDEPRALLEQAPIIEIATTAIRLSPDELAARRYAGAEA
jgi:predicted alpha-1,6-mannanase (GH76 family)